MSARSFSSNPDSVVVALGRPYRPVVPTFSVPGTSFVEDDFPTDRGWGDGLGMDEIALHLLCTLFLI